MRVDGGVEAALASLRAALPAGEPELPSDSPPPPPARPPAPPPPLLPFQRQLADAFLGSAGNATLFLPAGLGAGRVVDAVAAAAVAADPGRHVVVVVGRPAQALAAAVRLRAALGGARVAAFCGADSLYDFPTEVAAARALVFTAGLLMRLAKLAVYDLRAASVVVLHDAFAAIRNNPMNTLVREYFWRAAAAAAAAGAPAPRLLCVALPAPGGPARPFDRARAAARKLAAAARAEALLPRGAPAAALAARLHRARLAVHGYAPAPAERALLAALLAHALGVWDVLHDSGLNHFGRLVHFPSGSSAAAAAAAASADAGAGGAAADGGDAALLAAEAGDPAHNDWRQVALMVEESIAVTARGGAPAGARDRPPACAAALAVMRHVHACVGALERGLELGAEACLRAAMPALEALDAYLAAPAGDGGGHAADAEVRARAAAALRASPLLAWARGGGAARALGAGPRGGSRLAALLELLREARAHARGCPGPEAAAGRRVAVVAGDAVAAAAVVVAARAGGAVATAELFNPSAAAGADADGLAAAPPGELAVTALTVAQAAAAPGRAALAAADELVWFAPAAALHAAAPDPDSAGLEACLELAAVAGAPGAPGPTAHLLATDAQAAAWLGACRADRLLLAAAQLVGGGDGALEERLAALAAGGEARAWAAGEGLAAPSEVLEELCLGLCGEAPTLLVLPPAAGGGGGVRAEAALPAAMTAAAGTGAGALRAPLCGRHTGAAAPTAAAALEEAAAAALGALARAGAVAAYFQTRQLIVLGQQAAPPARPPLAATPAAPGVFAADAGAMASPFTQASGRAAAAAAPEHLVCPECGVVTTSDAHLEEHLAGRRHQRALERLGAPAAALAPAPAGGSGGRPPRAPLERLSTIERLPSSLSDAYLRRSSSLRLARAHSSGSVYGGLPCVRLGDLVLPSSMDLLAFLEEMQELGELEPPPVEPLPPIAERGGGRVGDDSAAGSPQRAGAAARPAAASSPGRGGTGARGARPPSRGATAVAAAAPPVDGYPAPASGQPAYFYGPPHAHPHGYGGVPYYAPTAQSAAGGGGPYVPAYPGGGALAPPFWPAGAYAPRWQPPR
jgi:hypothetical protein